jgi:hypothetical protein
MSNLRICLLLLLLLVCVVEGNHFLGGTITWRLDNASATGTPVAVVITQTYLWTYTAINCTNYMITTNHLIRLSAFFSGVATQTLNCTSNCGNGSVGYTNLPVQSRCTDISPILDVTVGQRADTLNLAENDSFSVAYQYSTWRDLTIGKKRAWSILSHIDLTLRSNTGLYNNAPVATMMSPINIVVNESTSINVPVGDPDGDETRCRWANGSSECGGVCPPSSLPSNTTIYPNCTISITGPAVGNWYAITLMVRYVLCFRNIAFLFPGRRFQ